MTTPVICTSIPRARLAEAAALGRAVEVLYGERLVVLCVDGADGASATWRDGPWLDRFRAPESEGVLAGTIRLKPSDLDLEIGSIHLRALCCDGDDLAASLVPALLRTVLRVSGRPVVALTSSTVLLGRLDELEAALTAATVVVIPRLLGPPPFGDDDEPELPAFNAAGAMDPHTFGVAPGAESFLLDAEIALLDDAVRGVRISREQRHLDRAATSFGAVVMRSPGYGVGAWNAHERAITGSHQHGYQALGAPLRTVNLEGFDVEAPELIDAQFGARPRVRLSQNPALAGICADRIRELSDLEGDTSESLSAPSTESAVELLMAGPVVVDDRMRSLVRRAVIHRTAAPLPPDPFTSQGPGTFLSWLVTADPTSTISPTLPRYLLELYAERRDLQWHFGRVGTVDMSHFREWVEHHGLEEAAAAPELRKALALTPWWSAPTGVIPVPPSELRRGVTVAGYLRAESGVGEAARLAVEAMVAAKIDVGTVVLGLTPSRQLHHFVPSQTLPIADRRINLIWTNAEQLPGFASIVGPEFFQGRYNVGFWAWESEQLPEALGRNAAMLDEIWVPSRYVRDAVTPVVGCPVHLFPHPIVAPIPDPLFDPASRGIPRGFTFLLTYDFLSSFARKNPLGVLEAFISAFPQPNGAALVLKSVNGDKRPAELERLMLAADGRRDVIVIDDYFTAGERAALIAASDCFVSLHRAEGFGLGLAEAMALAKPVIATGYSGNLDFMDSETAVLISATSCLIGPGAAPYEPDDRWAEPDLTAAAKAMRALVDDPVYARALGARAREIVLSRHGRSRAERFVAERIGDIEKLLRKGYLSSAHEAVTRAR